MRDEFTCPVCKGSTRIGRGVYFSEFGWRVHEAVCSLKLIALERDYTKSKHGRIRKRHEVVRLLRESA